MCSLRPLEVQPEGEAQPTVNYLGFFNWTHRM